MRRGLWQSPRPVSWRRWVWLVVPVIGLAEWAAHAYFASRPPQAQDWDELAPVVSELLQEGTLVNVAPYWAEPHARRVLGDQWMPLAHVARPDETGFARGVEISILGQTAELADWRVEQERQVGKFRLRVLTNPQPQPVLLDFVQRIERGAAEVFTFKSKQETPCAWNPSAKVENGALHGHPTFPKTRFECGDGAWHSVGRTVIEDQNYRPRRCIWAQPGEGKKTLIRFAEVTLGDRITGYGALPWFLERESNGTPVELSVKVGDEHVGKFTHADGEGWKRFEFATSAFKGQSLTVEFQVSSKRSRQREFCFQADIR